MLDHLRLAGVFLVAAVVLFAAGTYDVTADTYKAPMCPYQGPGAPSEGPYCHPYPQPRPAESQQSTEGCERGSVGCEVCPDCVTKVETGTSIFKEADPFNFKTFPGTNFLPNVYTNAFDGLGNEMVNTLPSTPDVPYNLHDGEPQVTTINLLSPEDDLATVFTNLKKQVGKVVAAQKRINQVGYQATGLDQEELEFAKTAVKNTIKLGLDILEGNPVENRAYSGTPVLHYTGPEKVKKVTPIKDVNGKIIGGNVDVRQVWYTQHIESDTALIDPTPILKDAEGNDLNVPWTVTYTVQVLNGVFDDFSPFVTYTDDPAASPWINIETGEPCDPAEESPSCRQKPPMANIGMDQSFFPMNQGTEVVFKIKMAPAKYYNLIYTWGWRYHPPRIQVIDKATKKVSYGMSYRNGEGSPREHPACPAVYEGMSLPQISQSVFCRPENGEQSPWYNATPLGGSAPPPPQCTAVRCLNPDDPGCQERKDYAIGRIGDLAPAKRMWLHLRRAMQMADADQYTDPAGDNLDAWTQDGQKLSIIQAPDGNGGTNIPAYINWQDRTQLPCYHKDASGQCTDGVTRDPEADITILYVNNTIYGQLTNGGWIRWDKWKLRGTELKVTAYNGDTFPHAYNIADFGGAKGWENQFKSSVKVAGSGCWFTFGRAYYQIPAGGPNGFLCVPPGNADGTASRHRFNVMFNYEPSRRLRFYQFDPFHHDVAIYSIH